MLQAARRSCCQSGRGGAPVPRQQVIDPVDGVIGDARQHVGEPGSRIDIVELCGLNQRVHEGSPLAATLRAGEEPGASSQSDTAQGALGGIVGKADAAVGKEAGERLPAREHVVHGLGDVGMAGDLWPEGTQWMPPLDPFEHVAELGRCDAHRGADGLPRLSPQPAPLRS